MSEKRMLIIDAETAKKIDENRGGMDQSSFIAFLIDSRLKTNLEKLESLKPDYITREDIEEFQLGIRDLLRNFMEFFLSYSIELGKQPDDDAMKELSQQLKTFVAKVNPTAHG